MKKIISLFLSFLLVFLSLSSASAIADPDTLNDYPVIFIPGFSSSQLMLQNDDGTETQVWMFDVNTVRNQTEKINILYLLIGLPLLSFGYTQKVEQASKPAIDIVAGTLATDAGGASVNKIVPAIEPNAEAARYSSLKGADRAFESFPSGYLDYDRVFVLGMDFRLDVLYNVERLELLIDSVLEDTGADKVNILCQSYGGQVAGTYLSKHAEDSVQKVNNVVMTCPALGGAALAYDFLSGNMVFDEEAIAEFAEYLSNTETDFHLILDSDPLDIIDDFISAVYEDVYAHVGTWPSFWDFVPYDLYRDLMAEKLDPEVNAELIRKTEYFHETYMKNFGKKLRKAQANGVNISIISGTGIPSLTGMQINSDGIIPVTCSSGAGAAPWGMRFNDGYKPDNTVCGCEEHCHLSPSMEIDASTCYLPDNTWFVDKYFHGQEFCESYMSALCVKQLLSETPLTNVCESAEFPQFHTSAAPSQILHAAFDSSPEGYVDSSDSAIRVTNSSDSVICITGVCAKGADLKFDYVDTFIAPGKTALIPFKGSLPEVSQTVIKLVISYMSIGVSNATPANSREFAFTLINGDSPVYDPGTPFVSTSSISPTLGALKGIGNAMDFIKRIILRAYNLIRLLASLLY